MTVKDLLTGQPAISQYEIMARADRLLPRAGRFYGGQLTDEQVVTLTKDMELKRGIKSQD